jgi:hypothetical protein
MRFLRIYIKNDLNIIKFSIAIAYWIILNSISINKIPTLVLLFIHGILENISVARKMKFNKAIKLSL